MADARQPREPAAVTPRQPDASAASGQTVTTRNYRVVQTTRALRGNHAPGDRVIKRLPLAVAAGGVEIENCQFAIKKNMICCRLRRTTRSDCAVAFWMTGALGCSPRPEHRFGRDQWTCRASTARATSMQDTLPDGTARAAQLAPSAFTVGRHTEEPVGHAALSEPLVISKRRPRQPPAATA